MRTLSFVVVGAGPTGVEFGACVFVCNCMHLSLSLFPPPTRLFLSLSRYVYMHTYYQLLVPGPTEIGAWQCTDSVCERACAN